MFKIKGLTVKANVICHNYFSFRIIEFKDVETATLAIEKMHRFEIKDRKLVVREVSRK